MTHTQHTLSKLWQARNATLLVHAAQTLFALGMAWPVASQAVPGTTPPAIGLVTFDALSAALRAVGLYGLVMFVCSPALCMLWLAALTQTASLPELTRRALSQYGTALRVTLLCLGGAVFASAAGCGVFVIVHRALNLSHDARLQDLAALGVAFVPVGSAVAYFATLHDCAYAAVALGVPNARAALQLGHAATTSRALGLRVGSAALALALFGLGAFAPPLLAQALALAITLTRGAWLARAASHVSESIWRSESCRS